MRSTFESKNVAVRLSTVLAYCTSASTTTHHTHTPPPTYTHALIPHTQAGVIETVFCIFAYFLVLLNNGLRFRDMTHPDRVSPKLAAMAATAYYVTLILSQVYLSDGMKRDGYRNCVCVMEQFASTV